jgi:integrase
LTDQLRISELLPGVHRVKKRKPSGQVTEHWYAWRGGPSILKVTAIGDAALEAAVARAAPAAVAKYQAERHQGDQVSFYGLVTRYLAFLNDLPEGALSERTKADRRKYLDVARADLGKMELRAFESRKARGFLITWRDGYMATPKTADERLAAVSLVLQWAADRGELRANPVKDFPRIYKVDRADIIWEPQHQAIILAHCALEFEHAFRFAALTGLREADLVKVPKTAIGQDAIVWQTGKSRGRKTIVVPITPPLRQLLAELPETDSVTILNSSRGRPWKVAGIAAALRRARLDALALARKTRGPDATSGIEGLRWHDLRGTAATNFILAGLSFDEVALIMGWEIERVREIAARYVSGQAMGLAIVKRLGRRAPKGVKGRKAG